MDDTLTLATHWNGWAWWWVAYVVLLVIVPLIYGWSYRGYGAPWRHPRRGATAAGRVEADAEAEADAAEQGAWGLLAVLVAVTFTIALVWLIVGLVV